MIKQQVKLSAIQLSSTTDIEDNFKTIEMMIEKITLKYTGFNHLIVLPECCLFFGCEGKDQLLLAQSTAEQDKLSTRFANIAKKYQVYLVAGTIPLQAKSEGKFTNSSCFFSPEGELMAQYDKIHLFDVTVSDGTKSYYESQYTQAGKDTSMVSTHFANIGLSVCFDLRFPRLFQQLSLAGADIITVPSAFTKVTGKAHWQTLLQARAIENQVYIIAAGQEGIHENGRETWGHSMIINPWGEIEKVLEHGEGYISVDYRPEEITRIRKSMPLVSPLNA